MSMHKVTLTSRIDTTHRPLGRRGLVMALTAALVAAGTAAAPQRVAAQAALGVPFIGSNHLSFYSTELATDGVGDAMSTLFGGRYARRFGGADARSHVGISLQLAARTLDGPTDGIADVSLATSWDRRIDELSSRLSVALSAGGSVLAWSTQNDDVGLANVTLPVTAGLSYDVSIGAATFTPFVAPSVAWFNTRRYVNDTRVGSASGWDARLATGASLQLKEIVLTAGSIRGEHGLPRSSRWTFAAGLSF